MVLAQLFRPPMSPKAQPASYKWVDDQLEITRGDTRLMIEYDGSLWYAEGEALHLVQPHQDYTTTRDVRFNIFMRPREIRAAYHTLAEIITSEGPEHVPELVRRHSALVDMYSINSLHDWIVSVQFGEMTG